MRAELPRLDRDASDARIAAALHEHGAVVVEGVIDPDLLARFNAELDPLLEAVSPERSYLNPAIDWFYGKRVRQLTGMATKSRIFGEELLCHPFYEGVCREILGPSCAGHQLNAAQVMDRGPGAEQQMLHRDEDVWVHLPRPHPEVQLASVIALVDFRAELGATVAVPGSHRWERGREARPEELACAEMPAGSAVLYLGSTLHAGGANTTEREWRRAMHMSFVVGWLRPEEASPLMVSRERAAELPPRARQLLGWGSYYSRAGGRTWLVDFEEAGLVFE